MTVYQWYRAGVIAGFVFLSALSLGAESEEELIARGVSHFDQMLEKYPPDKYHVIGLGPTVVVQSAAARLRLDSEWKSYFSELPVAYFNEFETLSPEIQRSLLPSPETVDGRKVVVFRVLMAGASMRHYLPDLAQFIQREKISSHVEGYFISPAGISTTDGFFPDWGRPKETLPPVTLVEDTGYAEWLNHRNLDDPEATIHGQTFFKHIGLDELEKPAEFIHNDSSGHLDQRVSFIVEPCAPALSALRVPH